MTSRIDTKLPLRRKVDLSRCTTMHVGGPAEFFAEPSTEEDLIEAIDFAKHEKIPYMFLGRGSNVIFSDFGYAGLIIGMNRFDSAGIHFHPELPVVRCSAGVQLYRFALACKEKGLGGIEFLSTIPGSVGGALAMNAGFSRHHGQKNEIGDIVEDVMILSEDGKKIKLKKEDLSFSYRQSSLRGKTILNASFHLWPRHREDIELEIRANFDYRAKEQDVKYPSSGSIFKNPVGTSAGRLIDSLGLKGLRVGDAMISEEHANYMINLGQAKSSDFVQLIEKVKKAVLDATGITLETEVILVP